MQGLVIPCNWAQSSYVHIFESFTPLRFLVADARNLIVQKAIQDDFEWLLFIDHDVIVPNQLLVKLNEYMREGDIPLVGGLYFTKGLPSEPLIYRGRGNSYFNKWHLGDKVWCDGMGLGCHLISVKLLKVLYNESESYEIEKGVIAKKIFVTPSGVARDGEGGEFKYAGTEDLPFYERLMNERIFKKAGFPKFQKMKYPFLCDTSIFCLHILENGQKFPSQLEAQKYVKKCQ